MTREKFYHLMDLVEEANEDWPTIQAEITYGHACTVHVYDSRNGIDHSQSWYWTDDPWQKDCVDGKPNGDNESIVTYYDPSFAKAECCLQQIIDDYKEKNNANA